MDDVVVLGASISGLLSALVLAQRSARVVVLERDVLTAGAQPRAGVPQGHHPHVLLARGRQVLDELLPGFGDELAAAGAPVFDSGTDLAVWGPAQRYGPVPGAPPMIGVTRALLEQRLRERVLAHPGITATGGAVATGLGWDGPRRVGAVRARVDGVEHEFPAELVVDATGRASRTPAWLAQMGHRLPAPTVVDPRQAYASGLFTPSPGFEADWEALYAPPLPGVRTGGALVLPVEGGRWFVGLSGRGGSTPPTDDRGFLAFADSLGVAEVSRALDGATPAGPLRGSRSTTSRWVRYDRLPHPPAGLVAVGDAVAAFNPVYGQGITAAALGALALSGAVDRVGGAVGAPALPRLVASALARVVRVPWVLATGADAQFPTTVGARRVPGERVVTRCLEGLRASRANDEAVRLAQLRVFHLLAPPSSLLDPRLLVRALRPHASAPAAGPAPHTPSVRSRTAA